MIDRIFTRAPLVAAALALAAGSLAAAQAAAGGSKGMMYQTKVGCTSPEPYSEFEKVFAEDGRMAAYKVLSQADACQILEQPTNVKLREAVDSFDFGWGTGKVWRVTKVNEKVEAPDEMFIRIRETDDQLDN
jgi:hypothetical protein